MKKNISFMLIVAMLFLSSSSTCIFAHSEVKEKKVKGSAKDCEFLYLLKQDRIEKLSLPNFTPFSSVQLPALTKGKNISIAGGCSDPAETILVVAKQRSNGDGDKEVLLSYNENLQLVAQLTIKENNDDDNDDD